MVAVFLGNLRELFFFDAHELSLRYRVSLRAVGGVGRAVWPIGESAARRASGRRLRGIWAW